MPRTHSREGAPLLRREPYPTSVHLSRGAGDRDSLGAFRSPQQGCHANAQHRALRISSIPLFINQSEFREYLEKLDCPSDEYSGPHTNRSNIRALSLVPDGRTQVATVVFHLEPEIFVGCMPGTAVDIEFQTGEAVYPVTVDCDFLGMTTLYSSGDDASVEWVAFLSHL